MGGSGGGGKGEGTGRGQTGGMEVKKQRIVCSQCLDLHI